MASTATADASPERAERVAADVTTASASINEAARPLKAAPSDISTNTVVRERFQSPLRYPGAKSALAPTIARVITAAKQSREIPAVNLLVEPFAGGGSASLRMISDGVVERVLLADADPLVAGFWQAAADDTDRLIERMRREWRTYVQGGGDAAVDRWSHWRGWTAPLGMPERDRRLTSAVRCLFLNRTTFSGILHGKAGPIGGRQQQSPYPINCRWNQDALEERLAFIGELYRAGRLVDVWCKDWRQTLDDVPEHYPQLLPSRVVAYLDPPYIEKSSKLYRTSFDPRGGYARAPLNGSTTGEEMLHLLLAEYLRTKAQFRWLLSYDNHPSLTSDPWLYARDRMTPSAADQETLGVRQWNISKRLVTTRYTAAGKAGKRAAEELLITTLPPRTVPVDDQIRALLV